MVEVDNRPMRVFDEQVIELLGGVSAELMKLPVSRQYPDLMAFAFYVRKANLIKLRDTLFPNTSPAALSTRLGRGLCFHIAPANIPVNFAFTWVFSLLAGNANIVRLPSKDFPQVTALLEIINRHLSQSGNLASRNRFVKYPRTDTETTAAYSAMADCRMIWGGDRTIASVRALPTKPRCVDIAFADRYSVGLINGAAIEAADDVTLQRLAQDFYNDTYLMDQNACSSPQLLLWENDSEAARQKFWDAVYSFAEKKYQLQDAVAVDKYTTFCEEAIGNPSIKSISRRGNLLYRAELASLTPSPPSHPSHPSHPPHPSHLVSHRGKAGFFFEYALKSREEFFAVVTEKFQTITQFGVDVDRLREEIVSANLRGIDRIVPFGKAMDIGIVWDGHELVRELSRVISVL